MKLSVFKFFPLVLFLACGCDKTADSRLKNKGDDSAPKNQSFEKMASNDVLVVVNGVALDRHGVEREVAIQMEIYQRSHPNAKLSDVARFKRKMLANVQKLFIQRQAMLSEAARRKIVLTDDDRQLIRRTFSDKVLQGKRAYEKFKSELSLDMRQELESGLDKDMLCQKVNAAVRSDCPATITDDELDMKFKNISEYNAGASADEARIWRNASNAWHRIVSGESFETVGKSYAETNEHVRCDMDWGAFELDFFKGDTLLCQYLTSMTVGSVTPPVTGDNGLLIVKLLETLPVDFTSNQLKPRYRLAMIFFALPEYYPLSTKEQLRKELAEIKVDREHKKRLKAIVDAARVEYPQGKCIMPKK